MDNLLATEFLHNSFERWIVALSIAAGVFLFLFGLRALLINRLRLFAPTSKALWDDVALESLENTRLIVILLLALHIGAQSLVLAPKAGKILDITFFLVVFLQIGAWANHAITFLGNAYAERSLASDAGRATTIRALLVFGKILLWILLTILLLDNWGVKVAPFVAGLGIGGIAIALAVQNILGDLLSSLSIVLDKPFVIGDTIAAGDEIGTVEYIGLKSTRVKSLSGEQLVFSNSDLLKSRIRNYKRMFERRVVFTFGLVYETQPERLHRARDLVKEIITSFEGARLERCFLKSFGASSLDFEVVYWVNSPDMNVYIDIHHKISVKMLERFAAEKLDFAYPTVLQLERPSSDESRN